MSRRLPPFRRPLHTSEPRADGDAVASGGSISIEEEKLHIKGAREVFFKLTAGKFTYYKGMTINLPLI